MSYSILLQMKNETRWEPGKTFSLSFSCAHFFFISTTNNPYTPILRTACHTLLSLANLLGGNIQNVCTTLCICPCFDQGIKLTRTKLLSIHHCLKFVISLSVSHICLLISPNNFSGNCPLFLTLPPSRRSWDKLLAI